jgi:hypothetical protein
MLIIFSLAISKSKCSLCNIGDILINYKHRMTIELSLLSSNLSIFTKSLIINHNSGNTFW